MVEMLRLVLGTLLVASFVAIAGYVLVSVAVAAAALLNSARRDRSADELDQVLAEILGRETPEMVAKTRRSRSARRH